MTRVLHLRRWRHAGHAGQAGDERGTSVLEVVIASAVLLVALTTVLATLASSQTANAYATAKSQTLDEMRMAVLLFSKEARQASHLDTATPTTVTMRTFIAGSAATVTYRLVPASGALALERVQGATVRRFDLELTTASRFQYTPTAVMDPPPAKRFTAVRLVLAAAFHPSQRPAELATEVNLRNV